jgi:hypothetical protein
MPILMVQPIPEKFRALCEFCQKELDIRDKGVFQHTSGWVMNRVGGGGHGVSLAARDNRWAHPLCVERMSKGTFGQRQMF